MNIDLPVNEVLPGDPAALRAAATGARTVADTRGDEASRQAQAARDAAGSGWSGPAATAFDAATAAGRTRIDELVAVIPDIAAPLLSYAEALERLRGEYVAAQYQAQELAARIRLAPRGTPETDGLGDAYFAACGRLEQIVDEARAANQRTAGQITALSQRFADPETASRQSTLTVALAPVGIGLAGQVERIEAEIGPTTAGAAAKTAGRVLGPIGAGLGQAVGDGENPNYSTAERIGRATGNAIFVGVPATATGVVTALGAAAAGAAVAGPVGAFIGGVAGAYAGSTAATTLINKVPFTDDLIDDTGEVFDSFGEQMRPPRHRGDPN